MTAELCGNNQGLGNVQARAHGAAPGAGKPVVERTATSAAINANQAPGMLAASGFDLAADKALKNNVAVSAYNVDEFRPARVLRGAPGEARLVCLALANSPSCRAFAARRPYLARTRWPSRCRAKAVLRSRLIWRRRRWRLRRAHGQGHGRAVAGVATRAGT